MSPATGERATDHFEEPNALDATVGPTVEIAWAAEVTVMVAPPVLEESATDVAESKIVAGLGTTDGAMYVTEVEVTFDSVPHVVAEHPEPDRDHATPLL